jgi:hypothetical protein
MLIICISNVNWGSIPDYITLLITLVGIGIALEQFRSYRKELKNRLFIEFRQRFKSDPINIKIFEFLNPLENQKKVNLPTKYEIYHFVGFYEELHKMLVDKMITCEDLIYFFGYYYLEALKRKEVKDMIDLDDPYWIRAKDLLNILKGEEDKNLINIKSNTESNPYKHRS